MATARSPAARILACERLAVCGPAGRSRPQGDADGAAGTLVAAVGEHHAPGAGHGADEAVGAGVVTTGVCPLGAQVVPAWLSLPMPAWSAT